MTARWTVDDGALMWNARPDDDEPPGNVCDELLLERSFDTPEPFHALVAAVRDSDTLATARELAVTVRSQDEDAWYALADLLDLLTGDDQ